MKKKLLKMIIALFIAVLLLQGCGNTGKTVNAEKNSSWKMEYIESSSDFEIYRDSETGVNYIIYEQNAGRAGWGGMCPRYNADGSLYVD